jgi:hypothetical protein
MKYRAAHRKTSDFSIGQVNEFIAEFGRQGGTPEMLQALIEHKARMVRAVAVAQGETPPVNLALCSIILGDNFISPLDVELIYDVKYSTEQMSSLVAALPGEKVLQWLRTHDCLLVATFPRDMNLLQVREQESALFFHQEQYQKQWCWFAEPAQTFARSDVVQGARWLIVQKEPLSRMQYEDSDDPFDTEQGSNVAEMAYVVITHYRATGIRLLPEEFFRTSSVSATGNCVVIGNFDPVGLVITERDADPQNDHIDSLSAESES